MNDEAIRNLSVYFLVHVIYCEADRKKSSCNVFKSINPGFTWRGK
jgi:hypothetical protein